MSPHFQNYAHLMILMLTCRKQNGNKHLCITCPYMTHPLTRGISHGDFRVDSTAFGAPTRIFLCFMALLVREVTYHFGT